MSSEKIYVTVELNRDYPVSGLLDIPGRIVQIKGVEESCVEIPSEREGPEQSEGKGSWIPHTGTDCPVHPLDMINVMIDGRVWACSNHRAYDFDWDKDGYGDITHYCHVTDPDGIPCVYDEGDLPEWAEYVATDEDGNVFAYNYRPEEGNSIDPWWGGESAYGEGQEKRGESIDDKYANTLVNWKDSLRRVWGED